MFLFFSKLLPLLIYPLGLTSLLLGFAIATFWKRPKAAALSVGLALGVLFMSANHWVGYGLVGLLEGQYPPLQGSPPADVIIVLGGCTRSAHSPRPWVEVSEEGDRLLYAAKLYREGKTPKMILTGGRVDWQGGGQAEALDMAELIQSMGVPKSALILEPESRNTYENALKVNQILKAQKLDGSLLLVTSARHMPRSMAIFQKLGLPVIAAPTDFQVANVDENAGLLGFILKLFPNVDSLEQTTNALKEWIGFATYRLQGWA
ncbi:MAG: YdcF family protein [Acaryochloris sp. RU_4_1]|nr:YdcF family protein [Acaryochloris sp. SU_5_25]NJM64149.1 YdcF family protein [Acaryochloris sp. RU_4_1]NJR53289.1 YdcF family protein [Acaryochloris sp. CRU_2_0]